MMNSPPPAKFPHLNGGAPTSILLDELIAEILSRLPVKTLMQFKCVCKSWKTLISHDSAFAKLHLLRSPQNLALVPNWAMPRSSDYGVVPFPVRGLLESPSTITPYEPYPLRDIAITYDPYYRLTNMDCIHIVGSSNGLICLLGGSLDTKHKKIWFRLWNPVTNSLSEKLGYLTNSFRLTFGYDISNDTYKVVAFSANKVKVFSFGDNVWRDIPTFPIVPFGVESKRLPCHPSVNCGVYVSGTVNWLAIRNMTEYEWIDISINQFVIVSLVLATEKYQQLLPPSGFLEVPPVEPSITVLMDCLCFSHSFKGTHFVLWKMMKFGVQESWTQFLKISFQDLLIDYGISDRLKYSSQLFLFPLYLSKSDETLIMASNQKGHDYDYHNQNAILYNWRNSLVEQIISVNEILWYHTKDYVESLVSTS